jgi:hypothetical protein
MAILRIAAGRRADSPVRSRNLVEHGQREGNGGQRIAKRTQTHRAKSRPIKVNQAFLRGNKVAKFFLSSRTGAFMSYTYARGENVPRGERGTGGVGFHYRHCGSLGKRKWVRQHESGSISGERRQNREGYRS